MTASAGTTDDVEHYLFRILEGQGRLEQKVDDLRNDVHQIKAERQAEAPDIAWSRGWRHGTKWFIRAVIVAVLGVVVGDAATIWKWLGGHK